MTEPAAGRFVVADVAALGIEALRTACHVLHTYERRPGRIILHRHSGLLRRMRVKQDARTGRV
jgi:hypothetical protein